MAWYDQVLIRPPQLPARTTVAIEAPRAVSLVVLAAAHALHMAPNENAPIAMRKVAP